MEIIMLKIKIGERFESKEEYLSKIPQPESIVFHDQFKQYQITKENHDYLWIMGDLNNALSRKTKKFIDDLELVFKPFTRPSGVPLNGVISYLLHAYLHTTVSIMRRNISIMQMGLWPITQNEEKWLENGEFDFNETFYNIFRKMIVFEPNFLKKKFFDKEQFFKKTIPLLRKYIAENTLYKENDVCTYGDVYAAEWLLQYTSIEKLTDEEMKSIYNRAKETKRRASGIKPSKEVRPIKLSNCIGMVL